MTTPVKKLLINAVDPEEYRIALIEDGILEEFYIETTAKEQIRGNIYKGVVAHVEPALQATFIDYGGEKNGFLQADEIHPEYHSEQPVPEEGQKPRRLPIQKLIQRGQEILVQVTKEETGNKGVALTTYISLPGRYLVLTPGQPGIGISRKIEDEAERERLKTILTQHEIPEEIGIIVRTAGMGKKKQELIKNLDTLLSLWDEIKVRAMEQPAPSLVYKEMELAIRTLRDLFTSDIQEILIDNKDIFKQVRDFLGLIAPKQRNQVKLYKETRPIFSKHQVESQIETIFQNRVKLKSGGHIVIDATEALVAVDVNSGRSVKERQIEETAFKTNLEAAEEIARQLRLRDLGGLIVIDFIDMKENKHENEVVKVLKNHLKRDKARTTVSKISKFGLLELSRQRIRPPIQYGTYYTCPTCQGKGLVRSIETLALMYLRKIWLGISKGTIATVNGVLPLEVANYLLNRKREELARLEERHKVTIYLEGQPNLQAEEGKVEFVKKEKKEGKGEEAQGPREEGQGKRRERKQRGNGKRQGERLEGRSGRDEAEGLMPETEGESFGAEDPYGNEGAQDERPEVQDLRDEGEGTSDEERVGRDEGDDLDPETEEASIEIAGAKEGSDGQKQEMKSETESKEEKEVKDNDFWAVG
jgi:ribonuclease E